MKSFGTISFALAASLLPLMAGCATTADTGKASSVSINKGSFETADSKLGNDIKSILAQGGLNTSDPAANPAPAGGDQIKTLSTTATDLQTLVAQLDAKNATPPQSQSAQTAKTVATAQTVNAAKTPALALAEPPKTSAAEKQIEATTQTTTFASIGTPGELIPLAPAVQPVVETAKAVKAVPTPVKKTRRVVEQADSSYKKPTVKRF